MIKYQYTQQVYKHLERCPFCGGKSTTYVQADENHEYSYFIECLQCHAKTDKRKRREDAVNLWNNRSNKEKVEVVKLVDIYKTVEHARRKIDEIEDYKRLDKSGFNYFISKMVQKIEEHAFEIEGN